MIPFGKKEANVYKKIKLDCLLISSFAVKSYMYVHNWFVWNVKVLEVDWKLPDVKPLALNDFIWIELLFILFFVTNNLCKYINADYVWITIL